MNIKSIVGLSAGALLLASLGALPVAAQSNCTLTLRAGEEGNVTAKPGDVISVCLPLNSGTGYSWQVQMGSDTQVLDPKSTVERSGSQPGAPGFTRFTMQTRQVNDYTLIFMLVPPGNTGVEAGRALFGLTVR